jgi:hypothetical protein
MTFQQVWQQSAVNLPAAAEELARLRAALRGSSDSSIEQDEALGAVAAAEKAAKAGDGPGMLQHLMPVGKWLLSFGEKLAVPVTMELLKAAMKAS